MRGPVLGLGSRPRNRGQAKALHAEMFWRTAGSLEIGGELDSVQTSLAASLYKREPVCAKGAAWKKCLPG